MSKFAWFMVGYIVGGSFGIVVHAYLTETLFVR